MGKSFFAVERLLQMTRCLHYIDFCSGFIFHSIVTIGPYIIRLTRDQTRFRSLDTMVDDLKTHVFTTYYSDRRAEETKDYIMLDQVLLE